MSDAIFHWLFHKHLSEGEVTSHNRWRRFWILLLIPASAVVLQASLCINQAKDISGGDPTAPSKSVTIKLENLDTPVVGQSVHLLGPGEDFSPANRLDPGQFRNISVTLRLNENVNFQAGRNGSVLSGGTKTCTCTTACPATGSTFGTPKVQWNGSALSCVGW